MSQDEVLQILLKNKNKWMNAKQITEKSSSNKVSTWRSVRCLRLRDEVQTRVIIGYRNRPVTYYRLVVVEEKQMSNEQEVDVRELKPQIDPIEGTIVEPRKISDGKLEYTVHGIHKEHFICFNKKGRCQMIHWTSLLRYNLV